MSNPTAMLGTPMRSRRPCGSVVDLGSGPAVANVARGSEVMIEAARGIFGGSGRGGSEGFTHLRFSLTGRISFTVGRCSSAVGCCASGAIAQVAE